MEIWKTSFGKYKDKEVYEYSLDNGRDLNIKVLSLGCIVKEINFREKNRVLGYDSVEEYLENGGSVGSLVGRVAGRISQGSMDIDGVTYELDKNEGTTCLHGGREGFAKQLWELVDEEIGQDHVSIKLKYISENLEAGFPGRLEVYTKYTVNRDNEMIIEYFAQTDKPTIITLTNHSYFNLNDSLDEGILDHSLWINADDYLAIDETSIPKAIRKVDDSPFDFRKERTIEEYMDLSHEDLKTTRGYDHPLILRKDMDGEIVLKSKSSGIALSMETTEPTVVLYGSNKLKEGLELAAGEKTFPYQGLCLETQWYPDAINQDFLPKNILRPGEDYYSKTSYHFSSEE